MIVKLQKSEGADTKALEDAIDALDLIAVLLAYLALHNYEENQKQNLKLDSIIFDMERKLEYQNKLLNEILRKVDKNGD
jgi:hypothetical protein